MMYLLTYHKRFFEWVTSDLEVTVDPMGNVVLEAEVILALVEDVTGGHLALSGMGCGSRRWWYDVE